MLKTKKYIEDLVSKTPEELNDALVDAKKELFNLRLRNAANQLENTSAIGAARKNIARIATVITQKQKGLI